MPNNTCLNTAYERKELERRLSCIAAEQPVAQVTAALDDSELHLVGGTVRDSVLGLPQVDLDLATRLRPEEAAKRLQRAEIRTIETGLRHGTLTALIAGTPLEITTFRRATGAGSTVFGDYIEDDLAARDFTINAMAYCIAAQRFLDPHNGLHDMRDAIVRGVGNPAERFREDPLRILRMVRLGPACGRLINSETKEAASASAPNLSSLSVERIRSELERIIMSDHPGAALQEMCTLKLLDYVLPELIPGIGFEQNEFHTHNVFDHMTQVLDRAAQDKIVRFAALFHDAGKPSTLSTDEQGRRHFYQHEVVSEKLAQTAMKRLRFSNEERRSVMQVVRHHMRPLDCGPAGVRRIMRDLEGDFESWLELKIADKCPTVSEEDFRAEYHRFLEMVIEEHTRQKGSVYGKLAVNGDDIIARGVKEGPIVGRVLHELEQLVTEDPDLNEREALLIRAGEILSRILSSYAHSQGVD